MKDLVPGGVAGFRVFNDPPVGQSSPNGQINDHAKSDAGRQTKANDTRFKLIPFESLMPGADPEYLIKDLFPCGGLIVVWGPPKCGKSFWTMDATLHVALGWEYRGRKVQQGAVVYCAFEGQSGYGKRAEAFRRQHRRPDKAAPDNDRRHPKQRVGKYDDCSLAPELAQGERAA